MLMNFIIAVVGESYNKCMEKRVAQTYKVKVDLIVERENLLEQTFFVNKGLFPSYILVRQPKDSDAEAALEDASREENLQKEIKKIAEIVEQLKGDVKPEIINKLVIDEMGRMKPEIVNSNNEILKQIETLNASIAKIEEEKRKEEQRKREEEEKKAEEERKQKEEEESKKIQELKGKMAVGLKGF